jgi:hypothetical protein
MYNRQNRSAIERAVNTLKIVREITPRILNNIATMYGVSIKEIRTNFPNMQIVGSIEAVEYYENLIG